MSTWPSPVAAKPAVFAPLPTARSATEDAATAAGRAAGHAAGYAAGWAQGLAAAAENEQRVLAEAAALAACERDHRDAVLASALAALAGATAQMNARTTPRVDDIVDLLASAAIDLAEVVVGREVRDAEGRGLTALRRALASAPEHEDVVVRLHPADLAAVTSGDVTALLAERAGAAVDLVSDTGVLPGDAVAEFPGGSVDARVATALTRMRTALRGAPRSGEEA